MLMYVPLTRSIGCPVRNYEPNHLPIAGTRSQQCSLLANSWTMSNVGPPLVGIVMPVRNAEPWLGEAIESIRNQTYPNWIAYVIDDGSDDRSFEIAREHEQDVR